MSNENKLLFRGIKAGILTKDEHSYIFEYNADYLASDDAETMSLTLPLKDKPYRDKVLFTFFNGLIPEGWLLDIAEKNWETKNSETLDNKAFRSFAGGAPGILKLNYNSSN